MALPSGNPVITRRMQFPNGVDVDSQRQWFPDERDGFIHWLKGEFAAANAIIDALCEHLRTTSEPGAYDIVMGCIQQRRCNWNTILFMQQYFSIADIHVALQQVAWRRHSNQPKAAEKDFRKPAFAYRQVRKPENERESHTPAQLVSQLHAEKMEEEPAKREDVKQMNEGGSQDPNASNVLPGIEGRTECSQKDSEDSFGLIQDKLDSVSISDGDIVHEEDASPNQEGNQKPIPVPRVFECNESWNGKTVNVGDGLMLYENILDNSEISTLLAAANGWRISGRKGEFPGHTFVASKRPSRGHGRDMLQFGVSVADRPPEDDSSIATTKEKIVEPIPSAVQDIIDQLTLRQLVACRPDYCIIDFFNEGDHSQPYTWQQYYGRPIFCLFLAEMDMVFGQIIGSDHRGNYRGALKLSLSPGSLLVLQGGSADVAKHAVPSIRKPRVVLLFGKSLPKKPLPTWFPSYAGNHTAPATSTALLPNHHPHRHHNHFPLPATTPAVLPVALPAAPIQPVFIGPPASPAAWAAASRPPLPGTGVFLPLPEGDPPKRDHDPEKSDGNGGVDASMTGESFPTF